MIDNSSLTDVPESTTVPRKKMRFSAVWIIPILAAVVALGIAVQKILSEGPTITIVFKEAEGIEVDKTFLKYKDVEIGKVSKVEFSSDFRKVVVTAEIEKSAAGLVVDDTTFWIEKPRATLSGISGLGTLLSGNYIGLEPGKSKKPRREFEGLETPPAVTMDQPGKRFVLQTTSLGSLGSGSPLYYRELNVGQVIGYELAGDGRTINVEVFVRAPYDKYVTDQARFWQAGGIDFTMGAEGISVQTQSVLSMLIGGVAFETPPTAVDPMPATDKAIFTLFESRKEAMANPETVSSPFVLYFNESLRGLSVGAPVTYLGLPMGEVTAVGMEYDPDRNTVKPRVDIVTYPERFLKHVTKSADLDKKAKSKAFRHAFLQNAFDHGLRPQLRSGSLLTGQLYIALDVFPDAPKVKVDWTKSPVVLPVVASGMQDMQNKVTSILSKVDKVPIDDIGKDVKALIARIDGLTRQVNDETMPEIKATLEQLKQVLASLDANMVGADAPLQQQMRDSLQEISKAAQSLNSLTEYLDKHPEALIKGKAQQEKP